MNYKIIDNNRLKILIVTIIKLLRTDKMYRIQENLINNIFEKAIDIGTSVISSATTLILTTNFRYYSIASFFFLFHLPKNNKSIVFY